MVNKRKIIIMSRLAIYDKNNGESDRRINSYFRQDYIYRKNMWTRFCVLMGCFIIIAMHWVKKFLIDKVDVLEINYKTELIGMAYWIIAALIIYSIIGGIKASMEYAGARDRMGRYLKLLSHLDRLTAKIESETEDEFEEASNDGAGFTGKGNLN